MVEIVKNSIEYFRPPDNYFWQWTEKVEIIEWVTGSTICYRDELMFVLKVIGTTQIPPISSVLLVLSACQESWKESSEFFGIMRALMRTVDPESDYPDEDLIEFHLHEAVKFLDVVHQLPQEYRRGGLKKHLFYEIFSDPEFLMEQWFPKGVIEEFESGRLDKHLLKPGAEITKIEFLENIEILSLAYKKYPTVDDLLLKVSAGIEHLPEPIKIAEPEIDPVDLLGQLEKDPKTIGIARLTKALVAALNIRMHAVRLSDLSFGGFSDITNRGSFDKLLLSELAQEDALLTARLVNNEALFLRREEPPDSQKKERVIFIDSSIRLWGIPKVFAMSVALGTSLSNKSFSGCHAYSLGGENYQQLDLSTKEGIISALDNLDPSLDCFDGLKAAMQGQAFPEETEFVFITEQETIKDFRLKVLLTELKKPINYIISISRSGDFQLLEVRKSGFKTLNTARIDLEELLFNVPQVKNTANKNEKLPNFINRNPVPLLFPSTGVLVNKNLCYYEPELGVMAINNQQRVLHWSQKNFAARELLGFIEKANYCFGFDGLSSFYILAYNEYKGLVKAYKLFLNKEEVVSNDLSLEIFKPQEVVFKHNKFYIKNNTEVITYDCIDNKIIKREEYGSYPAFFRENQSSFESPHISIMNSWVHNGYNVLLKFKKIYLNQFQQLCIDGHVLKDVDNIIKWSEGKKIVGPMFYEVEENFVESLPGNPNVKLKRFKWADGSEAVVDSRGFLHLKSSDANLPEVSILLVMGRASACWAGNEVITGSSFFTNKTPSSMMPPPEFYKKYIHPFIEVLQK